MKTGYYKADTINGVYFYDTILDDPDEEIEVLPPILFKVALKDLEEGETVLTFMDDVDEEIYNGIQNEYGIH